MRVVIKIGSNIISGKGSGLDERRIAKIVSDISSLYELGHEVVLVSSGAVAAGMKRLGLRSRPKDIKLKQAAAAVGQSSLMWTYEKMFTDKGRKVAQVLLDREDLSDRKRYINAKNTIQALLSYGVVPVVNENDTVSTEEIMFGDNDKLAALISALIGADALVILSDVDGLYSEDPRKNSGARLISEVHEISPALLKSAGNAGSDVGTGGMYSKLLAAKRALDSGIFVHIISGRRTGMIKSALAGRAEGTRFVPKSEKLSAREGWIAYGIRTRGRLVLDDGATRALSEGGKSLLPSGIVSIEGKFEKGDAVYCVDSSGNRFAKGLTNYSSDEIRKIMGKRTSEIEGALGYRYSDEVIHRDNMVSLK